MSMQRYELSSPAFPEGEGRELAFGEGRSTAPRDVAPASPKRRAAQRRDCGGGNGR